MSIDPIVQSVLVGVPPKRAFRLFTEQMGRWWAPQAHIASKRFVEIRLEPKVGGRWFERDADGGECDWGVVLAWEPPHRLLLGWKIDASFRFDPDLETEVEVLFDEQPGGSRVTLTHRNLERFGPSAQTTADKLRGGWPGIVRGFENFARQEAIDE